MPYYKDINILFIHIPKTGGTSIELFLKKKSKQTMYSYGIPPQHPYLNITNHSLQHQFYSTLKKHHKQFNIDFSPELKIITVVRNPYNRLISDLLFHKYINRRSTPSDVYKILPRYFKNNRDNHASEQYKYLIDKNNKIPKNIIIMKTETLKQDMINNGFNNFSEHVNHRPNTHTPSLNYSDFLNNDTINWVNTTYAKDFSFFNYKMKLPSGPVTTFIQGTTTLANN